MGSPAQPAGFAFTYLAAIALAGISLAPLRAGNFLAMPVGFQPNVGQAPPGVRYMTEGLRQAAFFTDDSAVFQLRRHGGAVFNLKMSLHNARANPVIEAFGAFSGTVNYLRGNDPSQWKTHVPVSRRLTYRDVYPGIDLTYYGNGDALEYDFVVHPGADSRYIAIGFAGGRMMRLTPEGELAIETDAGEIRSKKPVVYQEYGGLRHSVPGTYRLAGDRVTFQIGQHNRKAPLVIDPVLAYAGYLGGSDYDFGTDLRADATGLYVTGATYSQNLTTTAGSWQVKPAGLTDIFVIYATYIGGSGVDIPNASALAPDGSLYVAGVTGSVDFPVTSGAFATTFAGGVDDAFVLRLSPAGNALMFSTYVGGSGNDDLTSMFLDSSGNVYGAGVTDSGDFPVTARALQPGYAGGDNDAFVFKLNAAGSTLIYCTYLGGSGSEGFENPVGATLPATIDTVFGTALWVDAYGYAYVGGVTSSTYFPVTKGSYSVSPKGGSTDGYIAKLSHDGSSLAFASFFGGSGFDAVTGLRIDPSGNLVVAGITASPDLPVSPDALYPTYRGGFTDAFVSIFDPGGSTLLYSSYFGGSNQEASANLDLSATGVVLLSGSTFSSDLPVTAGTYQSTSSGSGEIYLAAISATRTSLIDGTYLGTPGFDSGAAHFGVNADDILLAGWTTSNSLATSSAAVQKVYGGGGTDMLLARLTLNLPLPQTISFAPLPNVTVGAPSFNVTATATSGLPVSLTSATPAVCAVSGDTVSIVAGGGCSITATQAGNNGFAPANPVTQSFTVLFGDVSPANYYYDAVNALAQHGITAGCGNQDYCPLQNVTRDQMAIFIVRAILGGDNFTYSATPYFSDVQPSTFGFQWIQKLRDLGITGGCTTTTYCPTSVVSRDEMAIFIERARLGVSLAGSASSFTYGATPYFTDTPASEFAFPWVQRMKEDSITSGCGATTYCPGSPVTRGDMSLFVMRGAFNQFLPAGTPVLTQISPSGLTRATTGTFTITGANTNFVQGSTTLSPIPGVTIGAITVQSPTRLMVELSAATNAVPQPYSVLAITGTEQDVLPNGLVIQ
jgi:hypothetical protein